MNRRARRASALALAITALMVGRLVVLGAQLAGAPSTAPQSTEIDHPGDLRVCADPNNLPFSNSRREGFENKLAELVARDLHKKVVYTWWPERRGFVRQTLNAGSCDVIMGVPVAYELVLTTRPYYRSTYVFVSRREEALHVRSFNDARLQKLRIGVHAIGAGRDALPPVEALARRGIVANVRGYSIYGDYSKPNPPVDLLNALTRREVDVAIDWGPTVGYFAARSRVPLEVTPVSPQVDIPYTPFVFDISMGVRHGDTFLRDTLNGVIERHQAEIHHLLKSFGVPLT